MAASSGVLDSWRLPDARARLPRGSHLRRADDKLPGVRRRRMADFIRAEPGEAGTAPAYKDTTTNRDGRGNGSSNYRERHFAPYPARSPPEAERIAAEWLGLHGTISRVSQVTFGGGGTGCDVYSGHRFFYARDRARSTVLEVGENLTTAMCRPRRMKPFRLYEVT